MTDLQKRIEEVEHYLNNFSNDEKVILNKSVLIIKKLNKELDSLRKVYDITNQSYRELKEECDKYKLLWESDAEDSKAIIAEQEEEIKQLKEKLNDK